MAETEQPHLFIEYPIPFIDVGDVALLLIVSLAREFRLLVNTGEMDIKQEETFTYSRLILPTTRSIASSVGLLSVYSNVFASL